MSTTAPIPRQFGQHPAAKPKSPYAPGNYLDTKVLSAADLHLISRFSYGITPTLRSEVAAAGGAAAWFRAQLAPDTIADPDGDAVGTWFPLLMDGVAAQRRDETDPNVFAIYFNVEYQRHTMARRIYSRRQVLEKVREFFEDVLHVSATNEGQAAYWRQDYGAVIARNCLGKFSDLLRETVVHPAMLYYLSGVYSTKYHPNENLGRELLELHTVGIGNYSEDDVKDSARILTGFTMVPVDPNVSKTILQRGYNPDYHYTGSVIVMDFARHNFEPDGQQLAYDFFAYLAKHPNTAKRLMTRLATKFVSDTPSPKLIDDLVKVYLANDTQIAPVLLALIEHKEFKAAVRKKVRNASDDVVATIRAIGAKPLKPEAGQSLPAANILPDLAKFVALGPFSWSTPNGTPMTNTMWCSPGRAIASMQIHWNMAAGSYPKNGITYQDLNARVPRRPIAYRDLVDHLSRSTLGKPSTKKMLKACCAATALTPSTVIEEGADVSAKVAQTIACLLDSLDFISY